MAGVVEQFLRQWEERNLHRNVVCTMLERIVAPVLRLAMRRLFTRHAGSVAMPPPTPSATFREWVDERVPGLSELLLVFLCGHSASELSGASDDKIWQKLQLGEERLPTLVGLCAYTQSRRQADLQRDIGQALKVYGLSHAGLDILHALGLSVNPRTISLVASDSNAVRTAFHSSLSDFTVAPGAPDVRRRCSYVAVFDDVTFVQSDYLYRNALQHGHSHSTNMVTCVVEAVSMAHPLDAPVSVPCATDLYVPTLDQSTAFAKELVGDVSCILGPIHRLEQQLTAIKAQVYQYGVFSPPAAHNNYHSSSSVYHRGYCYTDSRPSASCVANICLGEFKSASAFLAAVVDFAKNEPELCDAMTQSWFPLFGSADSWGLRIWVAAALFVEGEDLLSLQPRLAAAVSLDPQKAADMAVWQRTRSFISRTIPLSGSLHSEMSICKLLAKSWPHFVDGLLSQVLQRKTSLLTPSVKIYWYTFLQQLQDGYALALQAWFELREDVLELWRDQRILQSPPVASMILLLEFALPLAAAIFRIAAKDSGASFRAMYRLFALVEMTLRAPHYGKIPLIYLYAYHTFAPPLRASLDACSPSVNERRVELEHGRLKRLASAARLGVQAPDSAVLREFLRVASVLNGGNDVVSMTSQRVHSSLGTVRNASLLPAAVGFLGDYLCAITEAGRDKWEMKVDERKTTRTKGSSSAAVADNPFVMLPAADDVLSWDPSGDGPVRWTSAVQALDTSCLVPLSRLVAVQQLWFPFDSQSKSGALCHKLLSGLTLEKVQAILRDHDNKYRKLVTSLPDNADARARLTVVELQYLCHMNGVSLSGAGTKDELLRRLDVDAEEVAQIPYRSGPAADRARGNQLKADRAAKLAAEELEKHGHHRRSFHHIPTNGRKALPMSPISANLLPVSFRLLDAGCAPLDRRLAGPLPEAAVCDTCNGSEGVKYHHLCGCLVCSECFAKAGSGSLCSGKCRAFLERRTALEHESITAEITGMAAKPFDDSARKATKEDKAVEHAARSSGEHNDADAPDDAAGPAAGGSSAAAGGEDRAHLLKNVREDVANMKAKVLSKLKAS